MPPTPLSLARDRARERREHAAAALAAWQDRHRPAQEDDHTAEDTPDPPPVLTLFPLAAVDCEGCGAAVVEGQRYCARCDPWVN